MTVAHILPTDKIRSVEISTLLAIYWCGIKESNLHEKIPTRS